MKKNYAFSLIELMISLITISCITAAFAPVISKRLSANSTMVSSGLGSITVKCQDKFGQYCELCYKTRCIVCSRTCASNQFKDIPTCTCKGCSGYDANCASCDDEKCTKCKAGYILESGKCNLCPEGYSCNGGSSKTKCLKGTYAPQGSSTCKECNAGYYSDVDGAKTCSPCPKGTEAPNKNSTKCESCKKGYYASAKGTKNCSLCSAGKYTNSEGLSQCSSCNAGYTSNSDRTGCDICQPGTYAPTTASEKCYPCEAGTAVNTKGAIKCSDCGLGTYSKEGAKLCSSCEYGKYQDEKKQSSCKPCNSGYTTNQMGSTSSSKCVKCPDECTQCKTQSECKDCVSDYHLENGACIADYTDEFYSSVGQTTWTVPAGVTSIGFVVVGGGQPSGQGATTNGGSKVLTNNETIDLTSSTYAALKGNTLTVNICGAGGTAGYGSAKNTGYWPCKNTIDYWDKGSKYHYCSNVNGGGGNAGAGKVQFTVSQNATSLKATIGQVSGGEAGERQTRSSDIYSAYGGNGGGYSSIEDGSNKLIAGGGGGGSGAGVCQASCDWFLKGKGGAGGGGSVGARARLSPAKNPEAGQLAISWCAKNLDGWGGNNGKIGLQNLSDNSITEITNYETFSKTNHCTAYYPGYVEISWSAATIVGNGGKSGGCYTGTISVKQGDKCTIKVGSAGEVSSISCGSYSYSSNTSGAKINNPSGSTGGSGFKEKVNSCDTGGNYGKGGSGTSSSSPQPGTSGFVYTWKK